MENLSYQEIKNILLGIIEKVKNSNLEQGLYLEKNIIFDDKNETFQYVGDKKTINDILSKAIII